MIWAMLTLLFAVLLGGGGGSAEVKEAFKTARKQVKEVIAEPERQREVRSDLKQMNKLLDKGRQYQQKSIKKAYKVAAAAGDDEGISLDEYSQLYDEFMERIAVFRKDYVETLFHMKDLMTEDEWEAVFESVKTIQL